MHLWPLSQVALSKIYTTYSNFVICCQLEKKENNISINRSFHVDLFICLLAFTLWHACVKRSCAAEFQLFISLVFFQPGIIRHEHDDFKTPAASYEAFQGEISDFFSPPKLIIQEGEMSLIFQGRVQ